MDIASHVEMPENIRRWFSSVYPINLHKTETCAYCEKLVEPNRFHDIQLKFVIEHYEKQAYGFVTLETYAKGINLRELDVNNNGQRLIHKVNLLKFLSNSDNGRHLRMPKQQQKLNEKKMQLE